MKRTISILTLIAIGLCNPIAAQTNLISNGGFETFTTGNPDVFSSWDGVLGHTSSGFQQTIAAIGSPDNYAGTYSLQLEDNSQTKESSIETTVTVDASKVHQLSFYAQIITGAPELVVETLDYDGATEIILDRFTVSIDGAPAAWELQRFSMGPVGEGADIAWGANTEAVKLTFHPSQEPYRDGEGEVYLDEVSLTEAGAVLNPSFEDDFTSWSLYNSGSVGQSMAISTSVVHTGSKSLHLVDTSTAQGSTVRQQFSADITKPLQVSFWGYLVSGNPRLQIRQLDAMGSELDKEIVALSGSGWAEYNTVIAPSGLGGSVAWDSSTVTVEIVMSAAITTTTGEAHYDDIVVNPINLLDNGAFETPASNTLRNWVLTGSKGNGLYVDFISDDPYELTQNLLVGDASTSSEGSIITSADIDPLETYTLTFAYRNPSNSSAYTIRQFESGPAVNRVTPGTTTQSYTLTSSSTWATVELEIGPSGDLTLDGDTDAIRFNFYAAVEGDETNTGETEYDVISLKDSSNVDLIKGGAFEGGIPRWTLPVYWPNVSIEPSTTSGEYRDSAAARLIDTSTEGFAAMHQEAKVMPTGSYEFSFYANVLSEEGYVYIRQLDAARNTLATDRVDVWGSGWQLYQRSLAASGADIDLDSSVRYLLIIAYAGDEFATDNVGEVVYDDFVLFPSQFVEWSAGSLSSTTLNTDGTYAPTPQRVFADSFPAATLDAFWTNSGTVLQGSQYVSSPYAVEFDGTDSLTGNLDLTDYADVALVFQARLNGLTGGDTFTANYSTNGGASWTEIVSLNASQSWSESLETVAVGSAPDFDLQFEASLSGGAVTQFDDLEVWATPGPEHYLFPPQSLGSYTIGSTTIPAQPAWLSENPMHAHTVLNINQIDSIDPSDVVDEIEDIGAKVMVAHIQTGDEGLWYASAVSEAVQDDTLVGRNVIAEYLEALDGLASPPRFIGYRWIHSDRHAMVRHPEWASRNAAGEMVALARGFKMSLASGYKNYLKALLVETAGIAYNGRTIDGFFFDVWEMAPLEGDFNAHVLERYVDEYGYPLPTTDDFDDPLNRNLVRLNDQIIQETWQEITAALLAVNSEMAVVVANNPDQGAYSSVQNTPEMARRVSAVKTELKVNRHVAKSPTSTDVAISKPRQSVEFALNTMLYRDAGRKLPYIWNPRRDDVDDTAGFLDTLTGLAVTNGAILDWQLITTPGGVLETVLPDGYDTAIPNALALEPYVKGAAHLTWAVVHFSEREREARDINLTYDWAAEEWTSQAWGEFYWPILGSLQTLLEAHVPCGVITDSAIAEGRFDNIKVVIIPHPENLTPAEEAALDAFETGGGVVIRQILNSSSTLVDLNDISLTWHVLADQSDLFDELWTTIETAAGEPPIQVDAPVNTQAGFFRNSDGKLVVSLLTDSNWIDFQNEDIEPDLMDVSVPAAFDATVVLRQGHPTAATEQPDSNALTVSSIGGGEYEIDVTGIGIHTLIVIEGL